jgi:hypothetical protein
VPSPTRAEIEVELVQRTEDLLGLLDLSTQSDGANAVLNGPIRYGISMAGGSVASLAVVTDADVATVETSGHDKLLDYAEYRLLATCRNRWVKVRQRIGMQSEVHWNQVRDSLDKRLADLWKQLAMQYGEGLGTLSGGVVRLPIATREDESGEFEG